MSSSLNRPGLSPSGEGYRAVILPSCTLNKLQEANGFHKQADCLTALQVNLYCSLLIKMS